MLAKLLRFNRSDAGATAIEYGLIAALVAIGAMAGFTSFEDGLTSMWNKVANEMEAAQNGSSGV